MSAVIVDTDSNSSSKKRPAPRGTAAYPRKRGNTACQVCRARRTKCDRAIPTCSFCEKTGATCVRSPVDLSSFDPASLQILERIDDLSQQFRAWTTKQSHEAADDNQPSPTLGTAAVGSGSRQAVLFPQNAEQALVPFGLPKKPLLAVLKASNEATPGLLSANSPISSFVDLEASSANALVDRFFQYTHVKNPILDELSTRQLVSRLVLHGVDWSVQSCLALLVCALGTLATPLGPSPGTTPGSTAHSNAHSYFLAAQKRLGTCLVEGRLVQAQCLFLAGVYLMTIFRPVEAWRMFSQALACCQHFSFLNDGDSSEYGINGTSWSQTMVAEQAVYWSAWKSEHELRSDIKPPDFCSQSIVDFPKFFPTPPAPAETDTDAQVKAWTFYLTEISLRRQILMLAEDSWKTAGQTSDFEVEPLIHLLPGRLTQVNDWLQTIPRSISLNAAVEYDDICNFVLRGQVQDWYELLHCAFLNAFLDSPDSHEQEQEHGYDRPVAFATHHMQADLKPLAEKALSLHVERIQVNKPGFYHRHHGTWFMIRSCSRSATMLLRAAIHNQATERVEDNLRLPDGWHGAVLDVIELHWHWRAEAPDAAARLSILESMERIISQQ